MQVHTITVSFIRDKQPRKFEKSEPSIELTGALADEDDVTQVSHELMLSACTTVYAALGMEVPERILAKLGSDDISVVTENPTKAKPKAKPKKKTAAKTDDVPDDTPAPAKTVAEKKTDNVPDEKPTPARAKKQVAAKKKVDDVPDEESSTADDGDDVPDDDDEASAGDLQEFITHRVATKKISVADVKAVLAAHKAHRVFDVASDERVDVMAEIEKLCKD